MNFTGPILYKVQAASGLFFGMYVVMHFLSHLSLLGGWERGNKQLNRFRVIYHYPIFEIMLMLSLVLHLACNAVVVWKRHQIEGSREGADKKEGGLKPAGTMYRKAHRIAGYILTPCVLAHVFSTRIMAFLFLKNPEMFDYTMVHVINQHTYNALALFLMFMGVVGTYHFVYGVRLAFAILTNTSISGKPFPLYAKIFIGVVQILLVNSVLAGTGFYYKIDAKPHVVVAAEYIHKKMTFQ